MPRRTVVKLISTLVLSAVLGIGTYGNLCTAAYYAPQNMTRPQFKAAAQFGVWQDARDGKSRTFVLETPQATITGHDTRSAANKGRAPFGAVHLKPW